MNCRQAQEEFIVAGGGSLAADAHVRQCAACAAALHSLRQTMGVLDAWSAPEVSPYFDARLRSRRRAEAERPQGWREWLTAAFSPFTQVGRRVALVASLAVLVAAGVTLMQSTPGTNRINRLSDRVEAPASPGTPVADLQALDKNHDLLADFDLLDDVSEVTP